MPSTARLRFAQELAGQKVHLTPATSWMRTMVDSLLGIMDDPQTLCGRSLDFHWAEPVRVQRRDLCLNCTRALASSSRD